jgi:hypothetical protein
LIDTHDFCRIDVIGKFGFDHNFEGGRSEDAQKILNSWRNMAIMGISEKGFLVCTTCALGETLSNSCAGIDVAASFPDLELPALESSQGSRRCP